MIIVRALLIALFSIHFAFSNRILLDVKKLIRGKVLASGFSVSTKSLPHCIEYCNRRKKTCDGIVFHEAIQKCRLVNKCSPVHQVDNSSSIVYYSRRPQIMAPGYVYDANTDSCIGLITSTGNYAEADEFCRKQNAHLFTIGREKLNRVAIDLLNDSGIKWAWINFENVVHEQKIKPHGLSGNDVLPQEVFSPEVVQWRNNSYRSCWGVNNLGQWGQFSCKNETMSALCQVYQFAT